MSKTSFARQKQFRLQNLLADSELVSLVGTALADGYTNREILRAVKKKFPNADINRQDPNWLRREIGKKGMFEFRPPYHETYGRELRALAPCLQDVEVVSSAEVESIAAEAAKMLMQMFRACAAKDKKKTVNVGVAGGHTISALMQRLSKEMTRPDDKMPDIVHFFALAAGFIPDQPRTDPNSFVGFFDDKLISTEVRFTNLSAPAIVDPEMFETLKGFDWIKEAFDAVRKMHIFVTSGSSWHKCGVLPGRLPKEDKIELEKQKVIGDLLWRPISADGPIEIELSRRAFTLVELRELAGFVKKDKQVLMALAPCGWCGKLKDDLLRSALKQGIVTQLVVDARSAARMLGKSE